ncbi:MAG: NAD(P)/FAD-dependent oxidoreductase, partial [Proteobacteria bacterium]|nr:NAD(P)/FAD-dependent oxidoreductase [Pseudomonadota bacterium]
MQHFQTDIVIVGAGPVGLFAIFEAGMLKMRAHVVDTLEAIGGQCAALYPEKPIYDIPGYPSILAADLVERLHEQAAPFSPTFHLGQQVMGLEPRGNGFVVTLSSGNTIGCTAVIIAAGCGAFGPNRPPLEGLAAYEGKSVFYLVSRREDFRGKKIVIAGGGDSAVDWAISLSELAEKLYVVHRRPKFRCAPESTAKLEQLAAAGKVEMVIPYQLARLEGDNGKLSKVVVATLEGEEKALDADVLLPFFGLAMELGPIANWGLNLAHNHI